MGCEWKRQQNFLGKTALSLKELKCQIPVEGVGKRSDHAIANSPGSLDSALSSSPFCCQHHTRAGATGLTGLLATGLRRFLSNPSDKHTCVTANRRCLIQHHSSTTLVAVFFAFMLHALLTSWPSSDHASGRCSVANKHGSGLS